MVELRWYQRPRAGERRVRSRIEEAGEKRQRQGGPLVIPTHGRSGHPWVGQRGLGPSRPGLPNMYRQVPNPRPHQSDLALAGPRPLSLHPLVTRIPSGPPDSSSGRLGSSTPSVTPSSPHSYPLTLPGKRVVLGGFGRHLQNVETRNLDPGGDTTDRRRRTTPGRGSKVVTSIIHFPEGHGRDG